MVSLGRRRFVMQGSVAAAGLGLSLTSLLSRRASATGYGNLITDPEGILDLPVGFSYIVLERSGDLMDDGYVVPGQPDGMACFEDAAGNWVLMRNHEVSLNNSANGAYRAGQAPREAYDPDGYGGVTRVVIDPQTLTRKSSNLVLTGTVRNCSGGPSPWGWLSCEESLNASHGYVFLCPIDTETVAEPNRIRSYGRFNHEAAAVNPQTNICYLTEDRSNGCLYRFLPDDPAEPFVGRLQALRASLADALITATGFSVGDELRCDWVDLKNPNPIGDTLRQEAQAAGAAVFSRAEGIWYADGQVYICSTSGGPAGRGQIFRLHDMEDGAALTVFAQSEGPDVLDFPDGLTVAPWGQVFISEDGAGDQYVRSIDEDGTVHAFARNAFSSGEFAGVCFSPDGRAMFVNIQHSGITLMVTGPFADPGCIETSGTDDDGSSGDASTDASTTGDDGEVTGFENDDGDAPPGADGASGYVSYPGSYSCACDAGESAGEGPSAVGIAATTAAIMRVLPK